MIDTELRLMEVVRPSDSEYIFRFDFIHGDHVCGSIARIFHKKDSVINVIGSLRDMCDRLEDYYKETT